LILPITKAFSKTYSQVFSKRKRYNALTMALASRVSLPINDILRTLITLKIVTLYSSQ